MPKLALATFVGLLVTGVLLPLSAKAQSPVTVFKGTPQVKISEEGTSRLPETIARQSAPNLAVVISKIGEDFYWASRENVPMVAIDSGGAFVTYLAVNGSGYVKVVKPELKQAAGAMGGPEATFDYVEHLLLGLRSVTYYGARTSGR